VILRRRAPLKKDIARAVEEHDRDCAMQTTIAVHVQFWRDAYGDIVLVDENHLIVGGNEPSRFGESLPRNRVGTDVGPARVITLGANHARQRTSMV